MRHFELVGDNIKLVLEENVLGVVSDSELRTVSSAFYNGGFRNVKCILNVQVPEDFSDKVLHENPLNFVLNSSKKLGIERDFVGMVTAVKAENFQLVTRKEGDLAVSVIVTAGCTHAESAGEKIQLQQIEGTINIIVVIDGNPTDSCLTGTLLTATEAKTAALRDLDVRSRYSGEAATGTITDSMVSAATNKGNEITYGGPASKLGQLIGECTRTAVKDAIMKQDGTLPNRSIAARLKERHLPLEKIADELSKIKGLQREDRTLLATLVDVLKSEPLSAAVLMGALEIDAQIEKKLVPPEFWNVEYLEKTIIDLFPRKRQAEAKNESSKEIFEEFGTVDLPPLSKAVLVRIVENALFKRSTESLK